MIVIIGSTTADWFIFNRDALDSLGGDGFTGGNLVFCDSPPKILLGGNGGCSAYVSAGLGMPTRLCSAIGKDAMGDRLALWLQERGVNLEALHYSDTQATSTSTIIMSGAAHQIVFHHVGATREIDLTSIPLDLIGKNDVLFATSYALIPDLRSGRLQDIFKEVRKAGGTTAVDIGPAIGEPVSLDELRPLICDLDYLIANTHELSVMTKTSDWQKGGRQLIDIGAYRVVIKQGEDGATVFGPDIECHVPGFPVQANITVGAGDTFNVGFLHGVQKGWPLKQSLRFANGLAAMIVSSPNGVLDAPHSTLVNQFIQSS